MTTQISFQNSYGSEMDLYNSENLNNKKNKEHFVAFSNSTPFRGESPSDDQFTQELASRKIICNINSLSSNRGEVFFDVSKIEKLEPVLFNALLELKVPDFNSIKNLDFDDQESEKIIEIISNLILCKDKRTRELAESINAVNTHLGVGKPFVKARKMAFLTTNLVASPELATKLHHFTRYETYTYCECDSCRDQLKIRVDALKFQIIQEVLWKNGRISWQADRT